MTRVRFLLTNRWVRIYLDALSEVMGHHGYTALLRVAGLHAWIYNPPPYEDVLDVDAMDFALLNKILEDIYGLRAGRSLAFRAGQVALGMVLARPDIALGVSETALKLLPPEKRVKAFLNALAQALTQPQSVTVSLTELPDKLLCVVSPCPVYADRGVIARAVCRSMVGFLQAALEYIGAREPQGVEVVACGTGEEGGDPTCIFALDKTRF
jgi:hypothetical protein